MRSPSSWILPTLLATALAVPVVKLSGRVLRDLGADQPYDVAFVPRSGALRLLSPGLRLSIADAYWLSTVQYIGERQPRRDGMAKLFPLADLITDLDPGHGYAYQTAGIVLSAEGRLDESDRILEKGMGPGRPNWWSFPFYVAFNNYFYRGNYPEAARWAKIAARTPGASTNISHFAMALEIKSGSPDDALRFLRELQAVTHDERTSAAIEQQIQLALLQRGLNEIDAAGDRFRARFGRSPVLIDELRWWGDLAAVPENPYGGAFYVGGDGLAHSTVNDHRFNRPEPAHAAGWGSRG